jgi:hypothetical protein
MSWIEKELKRREALASKAQSTLAPPNRSDEAEPHAAAGIPALWEQFETLNNALPEALRLRREVRSPDPANPNAPQFTVWLRAPNGAGLALMADAIRYVWPVENARKSNNFWIRWDPDKGYRLFRRTGPAFPVPKITERRFKPSAAPHIVKCLVTAVRVSPRSVTRRRFFLF